MGSQLDGDILVEIIGTTYANLMPCLISSGTSYYAVSKGKLRCWFWHSWPQDYGLKFLIEFCYRLWGWLTDVTTRFTFRWGCIMFWAILNFSNVPMMLIFNLTVKMNEKCKIYFPCYVGCIHSTCFCCTLYYGYCFWSFLYIFYERMIWRIFFFFAFAGVLSWTSTV